MFHLICIKRVIKIINAIKNSQNSTQQSRTCSTDYKLAEFNFPDRVSAAAYDLGKTEPCRHGGHMVN